MAQDTLVQEIPRGRITDNDVSVMQRREVVVRLRAQGQSLPQIANAVNAPLSTVRDDLKWVRADWLRKVARNKAAWMAEVLGDLETLVAVAWEDYLASDGATKENVVETSEKGTKSRRARKTRKRDPRYLGIIVDASKFKASILGLGDKAAIDRVDDVLGKKRPKLLVVRDRAQLESLIDVTQIVDLDIRGPKSYGDRLRKKPPAISGQEGSPDESMDVDSVGDVDGDG